LRVIDLEKGGGEMAAKDQNFEMFAGDTQTIIVNVDFDLTGAREIKWVMKKSVSSLDKLIYKALSSQEIDITHSGPDPEDENTFQIQLDPEDTINLKSMYYHEAEVTDNLGNVSTVMVGNAMINRSGV
jgi:hypothetical protein